MPLRGRRARGCRPAVPGAGRQRELEGVILHLRSYGDAHRIVEVLTAEEGRLALIARGARSSRRRFAGALDLFVSLRMQCSTGGDLWSIDAADVMTPRLALRDDLVRLHRASLIAEIIRVLAPEHHAAADAYSALCHGLDSLERGNTAAAASSLPRALAAAGILPETVQCVRCGAPEPERGLLEPAAPGVICLDCASPQRTFRMALLDLASGVEAALDEVGTLEDSVAAWVEAHIGRQLRSHRALMAIRGPKDAGSLEIPPKAV
ncbi:MAG: DNA repair protein RecO [Myxococcota bacterium]